MSCLSFCPSTWHCALHKVCNEQRAVHKCTSAGWLLFTCIYVYVLLCLMCIFSECSMNWDLYAEPQDHNGDNFGLGLWYYCIWYLFLSLCFLDGSLLYKYANDFWLFNHITNHLKNSITSIVFEFFCFLCQQTSHANNERCNFYF